MPENFVTTVPNNVTGRDEFSSLYYNILLTCVGQSLGLFD
jgi:hypothetical protein